MTDERTIWIAKLNELLNAPKPTYKCDVCGSDDWRYLHEGDESNCQCEGGECWRVCNEWNDGEGCDGSAELVEEINA